MEHCLPGIPPGKGGVPFTEVADPCPHGIDALGLDFLRGDMEIAGEAGKIRMEEQRAMVHAVIPPGTEGVARKFLFFHGDIVAPAELRIDPQLFYCLENHIHLLFQTIDILCGEKGEVQVPQVVIDGAAAGNAPGQPDAVPFHGGKVAFLPGILVFSDDDAGRIDITIEKQGIRGEIRKKPLILSHVAPGIVGRGKIEIDMHGRKYLSCKMYAARYANRRRIV